MENEFVADNYFPAPRRFPFDRRKEELNKRGIEFRNN